MSRGKSLKQCILQHAEFYLGQKSDFRDQTAVYSENGGGGLIGPHHGLRNAEQFTEVL